MTNEQKETPTDKRNKEMQNLVPKETSQLMKDGTSLLDYGAIKCGNRFQTSELSEIKRWMENVYSIEELMKIMEKWENEEKKLFKNDDKKYEEESVYQNLMFRFDILTRMAKKDGVSMNEVFDNLRQFILDQANIFEFLTKGNRNSKSVENEGIHSYSNDAAHQLRETNIEVLWKQYLNEKNIKWKDVLIAESLKIMKLLPKAIESFSRLTKEKQPQETSTIRKLFQPPV